MTAQASPVAINADDRDSRYAAFGLTVVPDLRPDRPGPLEGIATALRWARDRVGADHVVTVPVDVPFLPADCLARLAAGSGPVRVARSGDRIHPVVGWFDVALIDDLEAHLASGARAAMMAWIDRHAADVVAFKPVEVNGIGVDPFFNVNTPADLAEAERIMAAAPTA